MPTLTWFPDAEPGEPVIGIVATADGRISGHAGDIGPDGKPVIVSAFPEPVESWSVPSSSGGPNRRVDHWSDGSWTCDCPDYEYRGGPAHPCKHIRSKRDD